MNSWWLAGLFLCSVISTGLCRLYALRVNMLDVPNQRSSHAVATPRGGGVGLVLTFVLGSFLTMNQLNIPGTTATSVILSGTLVALVGFFDDHYHVPALLRLTVHALASLIFLYGTDALPVIPLFSVQLSSGWLGYAIAGISLIWLLNLYNFMDGIDGIAAVEALSVTGGALITLWFNGDSTSYGLWLGIFIVAVAGFLPWNWPPAKIFMGDAGSGFIGFILGCFALLTSVTQDINLWSWLILLAVFIIDATVTLLRRLFLKKRFWQAHRSHAYQILSRRYNSHTKVTVGIALINIFWLIPWAVLAAHLPFYGFLCAVMAMLPLLLLAISVGAGTTND